MEAVAPPIFLLTDFGTHDHYVGHLKAVIAGLAPHSPVIDISHEITPFAIGEAAWLLEVTIPILPPAAIVVAVTDPGTGTARRALAVCAPDGRRFFGPDNGILSAVLRVPAGGAEPGCDVRELSDPQFHRPAVSSTFHGRDIFAPAAARVAAGLDYRRLGPPVSGAIVLPPFCGEPDGFGCLRGYVVHVDRYGNLVTTIRAAQLFPRFTIEVGSTQIDTRVRTFAEAVPGVPFCHADSTGFVAIALNQGDAASVLGVHRGDPVLVRAR